MTTQARGPFDVQIAPLDVYNKDEGAGLTRMSIDTKFHGELEATRKGETRSPTERRWRIRTTSDHSDAGDDRNRTPS